MASSKIAYDLPTIFYYFKSNKKKYSCTKFNRSNNNIIYISDNYYIVKTTSNMPIVRIYKAIGVDKNPKYPKNIIIDIRVYKCLEENKFKNEHFFYLHENKTMMLITCKKDTYNKYTFINYTGGDKDKLDTGDLDSIFPHTFMDIYYNCLLELKDVIYM